MPIVTVRFERFVSVTKKSGAEVAKHYAANWELNGPGPVPLA
jgi:hypothetical protein